MANNFSSDIPKRGEDRFRKYQVVFGLITLFIGLIVAIGWLTGLYIIASVRPAYVPMMPDTVVGMIIMGGVLCYDAGYSWRFNNGVSPLVWLPLLCACYGLLIIFSWVVPFGLPWHSLMPKAGHGGWIQQMAPLTGLLFFLGGCAMIIRRLAGGYAFTVHLVAWLGLAVTVCSLVIFLGYLFDQPFLYGGTFIPMALPTSLAFISMGMSIIMLAGRNASLVQPFIGRNAGPRLLRVILPIVAIAIIAHGFCQMLMVRFWNLNPALVMGVMTILFLFVTGTVIINLAQRLFQQAEEGRRKAEAALRESEIKYRSIFDNANDGIFLLDDEKIIDCNARAAQMLQRRKEDIVGHSPVDLSPQYQANGYSSAEFVRSCNRELLDGERPVLEWQHLLPDGTLLDTEVSLNMINLEGQRYIQSVVRNISARKRLEQELRESEIKFRTIFNNSSDGIVISDAATGSLIMGNPKICNMLGYTPAELVQLRFTDLYTPEDAAMIMSRIKEAESRTFEGIEVPVRRKNGTVFYAQINGAVMMLNSHHYAIGAFRDITSFRESEKELRHARDVAESASRSKTEFIGSVSHELRTPLNGIIGFSGLLREELPPRGIGDDDPLMLYLDKIVQCTETLSGMIDNIIELSQLESGHFREVIEEFYPGRILKDCMSAFDYKAKQKQLDFDLVTGNLPAILFGDHRRLRQILLNLIGNAVKFTEQGSIEVRVIYREDRLLIVITDTGIGITETAMGKITELFHQEDQSATRRYGGSGLGLAVVARMLLRVNGKFTIESKHNRGTRVTVEFPAHLVMPGQ